MPAMPASTAAEAMGQLIVIIGLVIAAIGAAIWLGVPLGRLPGDLVIQRDGFTLYLPITTCVIASLLLMLARRIW